MTFSLKPDPDTRAAAANVAAAAPRSSFPPPPEPMPWLRGDTIRARYAALAAAQGDAAAATLDTAERTTRLVARVHRLRERALGTEREVLEAVPHPALIGDRERCHAVNTALLELLGCAREDVEGVRWEDLLWPPGFRPSWPTTEGAVSLPFRFGSREAQWWISPPGAGGLFRAVCECDPARPDAPAATVTGP